MLLLDSLESPDRIALRESDGDVELTGKDRVVGYCLALIGLTQIYESATVTVPNKKVKVHFETKDLFREKIHAKVKA